MTKAKPSANKMWGGHYVSGPAEIMAKINECIDIDKRLYAEEPSQVRWHMRKCWAIAAY